MAELAHDFPTTPDGMADPECQCARCGSSAYGVDCDRCGGAGEIDERDDLFWPRVYPCDHCGGRGGWWQCCSGEDWCRANPMPGREAVEPGVIEWFDIAALPTPTRAPARGDDA